MRPDRTGASIFCVTVARPGPVVIGYDGSGSSDRAIRAAAILATRRVLVVHVFEPGAGFELYPPSVPPAPVDLSAALTADQILAEGARKIAEQGANTATQLGLESEAMAVPDMMTVAGTLVELVRKYDSPAVVVGAHGQRPLREVLLGSTTQELIKTAPCPVVVVGPGTD
jgi:nucleotide-binding universal stress UspA family protein